MQHKSLKIWGISKPKRKTAVNLFTIILTAIMHVFSSIPVQEGYQPISPVVNFTAAGEIGNFWDR